MPGQLLLPVYIAYSYSVEYVLVVSQKVQKIFFVITTIPQKTGGRGQTVTWRQYFSYSCEGRKPLGLPKSGQEKYG